jgi:hypothetical protein
LESRRNGLSAHEVRSTYTVPPYGMQVVFTDTVKEFHALRFHKDYSVRELHGAFDSGKVADCVVGVFDGKLLTLVHECVHAASVILQACGIDPLSNNSEPLAYLVDHLTAIGSKRLKLR